MKFGHVVFETC